MRAHAQRYVPSTAFILHNVEDEEKVFDLCHDREKLASIAWLIKTAPGAALSLNKKKSGFVTVVTLPQKFI